MTKFNFNELLDLMTTKYQSIHGEDKIFKNGLRYFKQLEPLVTISSLEEDTKIVHLAYIGYN